MTNEKLHNILSGGAGSDIYDFDNASNTITGELATAGEIDTVQYNGTSGTFIMGDNVENIILLGTDTISARGNASDNTMTGNPAGNTLAGLGGDDTINGSVGDDVLDGGNGNDKLDGMAGDDNLIGGVGNDTYIVDSSFDIVDKSTGTGVDVDTVNSSVSYVLNNFAANVENLTLTGATAVNGTGNALANTITGNSAVNILTGLAGNDTITAGAGADTIDAGGGNDIITGGSGRDVVTTGLGNDTITFAGGVADTLATASSIAGIDLYGDLVLNAATADKLNLTVVVANVNTAVGGGAVHVANFITNMNNLLSTSGAGFNTGVAGDISAAVVNVSSGDLSGQKFLAVDLDHNGAFTATDFVIEITGSTVTSLTTASFI